MFNYWLLKLPNFAKSSRKWFDIRLVQCAINHKLITTCDFFLNSYRSPTFITELIIAITSTLIIARDFMTEKLLRRLR
jgi:hypothetical protein